MWQMKLLLWVLSEILQRMSVIPPIVQPELERLFKKLINNVIFFYSNLFRLLHNF